MNTTSRNYITLKEATEHCQYTQEYLSLRARQGKLKAAKIENTWFTTKEWLQEYIDKTAKYKEELSQKLVPQRQVGQQLATVTVPPPANLPEADSMAEYEYIKKEDEASYVPLREVFATNAVFADRQEKPRQSIQPWFDVKAFSYGLAGFIIAIFGSVLLLGATGLQTDALRFSASLAALDSGIHRFSENQEKTILKVIDNFGDGMFAMIPPELLSSSTVSLPRENCWQRTN